MLGAQIVCVRACVRARARARKRESEKVRVCGGWGRRASTMALLAGSAEGRARLSRLATAVTAGFVPVVAAARERCALVSEWIARLS